MRTGRVAKALHLNIKTIKSASKKNLKNDNALINANVSPDISGGPFTVRFDFIRCKRG